MNRMSRKQLMGLQRKRLREIVQFAYENCPFYTNLYTKHGIKKEHIDTIHVNDLPIVNKVKLMEHFENVVTDKRLKYKDLQKYIEENSDPKHNYLGKYKILHTSGTSGTVGIYPIAMHDVAYVIGRLLKRVAPVSLKHLLFKQKIAYFAATHGHFVGVTFLVSAPKATIKVKTFSILQPTSEIVDQLNRFQPEEVTGYASSMEMLADQQKQGRLKIKPLKIVCGGDPLYDVRRKKIYDAFGVDPSDSYSMTEGMGVGNQLPGDAYLSVFDDLYLLEADPNTKLTNLYNRTFPIIRYENDDVIDLVENPDYSNRPFTQIREIEGRDVDFLHIINNKGEEDLIHPAPLVEFYVEGLNKIQFWRQPGNKILVKAVGFGSDFKERVWRKMVEILKAKQADKSMKVEVLLVDDIPVDQRTGKFRLVNEEK